MEGRKGRGKGSMDVTPSIPRLTVGHAAVITTKESALAGGRLRSSWVQTFWRRGFLWTAGISTSGNSWDSRSQDRQFHACSETGTCDASVEGRN